MANFSEWVRAQLRLRRKRRTAGMAPEREVRDLPVRQIAALLVNRLNADYDNRPHADGLCADAVVEWLRVDAERDVTQWSRPASLPPEDPNDD